jgi:hypothetical protein
MFLKLFWMAKLFFWGGDVFVIILGFELVLVGVVWWIFLLTVDKKCDI